MNVTNYGAKFKRDTLACTVLACSRSASGHMAFQQVKTQYANLNLLLVTVVACFLTGCVSGTASLKGYTDIPREQAAILLAKRLCTPNWAFNLDLPGIHQLREHCGTAGCSEFMLPPGRYHVFYRCGSHFAKGTTSVEFEVVILEAGHQYTIDFNGWFGAYHAVLIDMLTGKSVSRERK